MKLHNPFTHHPRKCANRSYFQHFIFAMGLGVRLMLTGYVFTFHAMFPFIKIPAKLNLTETALHLHREEENRLRGLQKK
tara:strand:+ start:214 stop:450 length:237 start_codon:yes stop_codon:yes gene_type:complete